MKPIKHFLILAFSASHCLSVASESEIYNPFFHTKPDKINSNEGYCKGETEERLLWRELNKFVKSLLTVFPQIPPEQRAYLLGEIKSNNSQRMLKAYQSPIYQMQGIYDQITNIEKLSSQYLSLTISPKLEKKTEFIGRTLFNIDSNLLNINDFDTFAIELRQKGYDISSKDLALSSGVMWGFKKTFYSQLICYGEALDKLPARR
jgi:hypothetical protein